MISRRNLMIFGGMVLIGGAGIAAVERAAPGAGPAGPRLVSSSEALHSAIRDGAVIRLAPGRYAGVSIRDFKGEAGLVLESARPEDPAILEGLMVSQSSNVTLRNLRVAAGPIDPNLKSPIAVTVKNSDRVTFRGVQFKGTEAPPAVIRGYAMLLRDSREFRLEGSSFTGFRYGIGMLNSRQVTIDRNEFFSLQTDAIRGGGVNDLTVTGNIIGNFHPAPGDHPDGIQLWSADQTESARNIVIRDNLIYRDDGGVPQGIFIRDNRNQLPFQNVEIAGNLVIGAMYNGIALMNSNASRIVGNDVLAYPDQKSFIRIDNGNGMLLENNRSMVFAIRGTAEVNQKNNRVAGGKKEDAPRRITEWLAARPHLTATPGPYLSSIIARSNPR